MQATTRRWHTSSWLIVQRKQKLLQRVIQVIVKPASAGFYTLLNPTYLQLYSFRSIPGATYVVTSSDQWAERHIIEAQRKGEFDIPALAAASRHSDDDSHVPAELCGYRLLKNAGCLP